MQPDHIRNGLNIKSVRVKMKRQEKETEAIAGPCEAVRENRSKLNKQVSTDGCLYGVGGLELPKTPSAVPFFISAAPSYRAFGSMYNPRGSETGGFTVWS